jgi:ubiquinone/menaquinone biosynthesis C-methylase UbiE
VAGEHEDHVGITRATYDRIAPRYLERQVTSMSRVDRLFAPVEASFAAALPRRGVVADMGCGPGLDGARWANAGYRVIGLDLSAGMLDVARERLGGRLIQGDLRRIPIGDGRLDGIWSAAALVHVPEPDTEVVLREFRRTLRDTGTLALVTAVGEGERFEPVPYAPEERRWFIYREPRRLAAQLAESGLHVEQRFEVPGTRHWLCLLATAS